MSLLHYATETLESEVNALIDGVTRVEARADALVTRLDALEATQEEYNNRLVTQVEIQQQLYEETQQSLREFKELQERINEICRLLDSLSL